MLKRVSIQNFKSLKDVTLDLQKVNLLIGPNNSGKTNFLKALEFFQKSSTMGNVTMHRFIYDGLKNYSAQFLIQLDREKSIEDSILADVVEEHLGVTYQHSKLERKHWYTTSSGDQKSEYRSYGLDKHIFDFFGSDVVSVYKIDSNKLDKPAPVGLGAQIVSADASNLIAFFDYIRDEKPQAFAQIRADLNKCVPEFTEINFQSVEPSEELIKQFGPATYKRIGLTDGRQNTIYWADELSEGTLYFLALLCIINQPNPPKLLLLEEPEKGIHPRRIEEVINFIFGLADDKDVQVIMTTHSPAVVDMFKDMPESVFIFDKDEEGATHVKNLLTDVIEPETEESKRLGIDPPQYLNGLGEAWKVGFLGGVPR